MALPDEFRVVRLDGERIMAIARLGWEEPTLIQEKAIPYMLEGKDVLARARTGSGKTGAFVIPAIHKILEGKKLATEQAVKALILAPSKELCKQITENITQLTSACKREVRAVDVSGQVPLEAQRPLLVDKPDIVVGTPMRLLGHISAGNLDISESLEILVVDEADLMFAFDHEKDIQAVLKHLPKIYQSFVTSATMCEDVRQLKKLVLHNPVVLKLEEPPLPNTTQLTQYVMKIDEFEKCVILYSLFRLNMIRGKTIIFVNSVDRGYKLRMFLGQFNISSCVLNSEMPVASRCNIVEQFNKGKFDIIVASDERSLESPEEKPQGEKKGKKRHKDKESGVSRGIDFQFVSNIVNFEFPMSVNAYIHRVGRTARGNNQGTALSLVSANEMKVFSAVESKLKTLIGTQTVFQDFKFDMTQLDGFRYRANDAWRRCTSIAIHETRKKELRQEILNSAKLRTFFQDNPRDLQMIRHDKATHALSAQREYQNLTFYLILGDLDVGKEIIAFFKQFYSKFTRNAPKSNDSNANSKRASKNHAYGYSKRKINLLVRLTFAEFKK
ncbi:unnamed protein product, partial [Meganyctiphanes norvegica]